MKTRLFNIAWSVRKHFATFAEALVHAWKVVKLQIGLCLGIVKFQYKKIDGSIRQAIGTLDEIPAEKRPAAGTPRKVNFGLLTYFDIEAGDFRSAKIENLIF